MMAGSVWGLFGDPIVPYIIHTVAPNNQDAPNDSTQYVTRIIGILLFIIGVIFLYFIYKLPSDSRANCIANDAETIKKSIIDLNLLYSTLIDKALTYNTNDYLPFIKNDIAFQKDLKKYKDKGVAIRSYIAYNPDNPLLEDIIKKSENWGSLDQSIRKAAISISDRKLSSLLRTYRSKLFAYGQYKVQAKIILDENPVTSYNSRQVVSLNQSMSEFNVEVALEDLMNHLNELISEYGEESVQKATVDATK